MLGRGRAPHAARLADHHRHLRLAAEHVTCLRRLIDHLVNGAKCKISEPQLHDRSGPRQGTTDGRAHNCGLGDRSGDNTFRSEFFLEAHVLPEDAATSQILTDSPDRRICAHRFSECRLGRIAVTHHAHSGPPTSCTSDLAADKSGQGASRAASNAAVISASASLAILSRSPSPILFSRR